MKHNLKNWAGFLLLFILMGCQGAQMRQEEDLDLGQTSRPEEMRTQEEDSFGIHNEEETKREEPNEELDSSMEESASESDETTEGEEETENEENDTEDTTDETD